MKFTILGFSQKKAIELGIDLDGLLLLRYFIDFKESDAMVTKIFDGKPYYWVNYETFREELPILKISKDRIYRKFKGLVDAGILLHKTEKRNGTYSFYTVGPKYFSLISDSVKITEGYGKNNGQGTVKTPDRYGENTRPKDSSTKDTSTKDSSIKDIYSNIVNYLNSKANTNYKPTTKKTLELIKARISEGFTEDNFYTVIDKKCLDWKGTEFEQHLTPNTLFGTKFEGYLNQKFYKKQDKQPDQPKQKGNFNNYEQRTYDYKALENKLLGWDNNES